MNTQNIFRERVLASGGVPILFETIPPRRDSAPDKLEAWRDRIVQAMESVPVTAVNVPEIRDETREGERTYKYNKRLKPREFGQQLREAFTKPIDLVINRVVVYRTVEQQKAWLDNSHQLGVRNLILVGGESHRVDYPGPSVAGMAKLITEEVNSHLDPEAQWLCGGITIPSRRRADPDRDEPGRLLAKAEAGIQFFTTQVIYEADRICRLLWDYSARCESDGKDPRRIFLSMAPICDTKHIEFLRWLGVEIPPGVEAQLVQNGNDVAMSSLDVCTELFRQISDFNKKLSHPIPLGLNISSIFRSCFDLGVELTGNLAELTGE